MEMPFLTIRVLIVKTVQVGDDTPGEKTRVPSVTLSLSDIVMTVIFLYDSIITVLYSV